MTYFPDAMLHKLTTSFQCLICLDDYEEEDDVRLLSCKHAFHKNCVDHWLKTGRNNCPACRSTVGCILLTSGAIELTSHLQGVRSGDEVPSTSNTASAA